MNILESSHVPFHRCHCFVWVGKWTNAGKMFPTLCSYNLRTVGKFTDVGCFGLINPSVTHVDDNFTRRAQLQALSGLLTPVLWLASVLECLVLQSCCYLGPLIFSLLYCATSSGERLPRRRGKLGNTKHAGAKFKWRTLHNPRPAYEGDLPLFLPISETSQHPVFRRVER